MTDLEAGSRIAAIDSPQTVWDRSTDAFEATSTSYTTSTSLGSYEQVGVVFVAPTTGRVRISVNARMLNSGTGGTLVAAETRVGPDIGAGSLVQAAADATGASHYGTSTGRSGIKHLLTGLTPGQVYNTRLLHRVSSGTGTFANRALSVKPAT